MLDWLPVALESDSALPMGILLGRLALALVLGCVVAAVQRLTTKPEPDSSLRATLVLLTVVIAMVTLVIGDNVARAFSLVGALAIVRFRTVVEDTRDTAFVILAVAVGMAIGAGFVLVPVVGIPFAATAAFLYRPRAARAATREYIVVVRIGTAVETQTLLTEALARHVERSRLVTLTTARQGAAFELTYDVFLRSTSAAPTLLAELNSVAGVQQVELRQSDR